MTEAQQLVANVYRDVDAMDVEAFAARFTEGGVMVFGNDEPLEGRDAVRQGIGGFFGAIAGIQHHVLAVFQDGDAIITDLSVDYTLANGTQLTMPAATVWRMDGELIADYKAYVDRSPLFAALEAA